MLRKIVLGFVLIASLTGCLKGKDSCNYDACAYKVPDSEIQAVQNYLASKGITNAVQHCSGLFYVIETEGTGKKPSACSTISAHYVGSLTNGNIFDQGDFTANLNGGVIQGWTNGIPLIRQGGKIHLYVPPSLGYGSRDYGPIPGNSVIIFDVDLTGVQ